MFCKMRFSRPSFVSANSPHQVGRLSVSDRNRAPLEIAAAISAAIPIAIPICVATDKLATAPADALAAADIAAFAPAALWAAAMAIVWVVLQEVN